LCTLVALSHTRFAGQATFGPGESSQKVQRGSIKFSPPEKVEERTLFWATPNKIEVNGLR
jgi:hypothetical protein